MNIAVIGSRDFPRLWMVEKFIELLPKNTNIISGGASGVDSCAERTARTLDLPVKVFLPNYAIHGSKHAPLIRNEQIINASDLIVAFWSKVQSRGGTYHVLKTAKQLGRATWYFLPYDNQQRQDFVAVIINLLTSHERYSQETGLWLSG